MTDRGTITRWIGGLRKGDPRAAEMVWQHFFDQLIPVAKRRLQRSSRRVADEDDVVVDVFDSFFRGARSGRFPELYDRGDLWEVLLLLTCRKSTNQMIAANRLKRGAGGVRGDSAFGGASELSDARMSSSEPTPEFAAEFAEQLRLRLDSLKDPVLEKVALLKLEGYSNEEIAGEIGRKLRTVERKLRTIRELWTIEE